MIRSIMGIRGVMVMAIAIVATLLSIGRAEAQETSKASIEQYNHYTTSTRAPRIHTEWGIGVGGVYTGLSSISTTDVKLKPRIGFQGHLDFAVCFGRFFALETEIAYEGGSIKAINGELERKIRTRTIDIPVLLSLRMLGSRIRLTAGPLFTVMSKAEYTFDSETMFFGPVYPTWNLAAGVAVGLSRHFLLEARYVHSLKECHNQFNGLEFKTRPYKITAGVVLIF